VSVSIWELNQRATEIYAKNAVEDAEPKVLPEVAIAACEQAAREFGLSLIESTDCGTFSAAIYSDESGTLVNFWRHTPNAQYLAEYFDGVGFDDDIGWAYG
jgi:hypothetical protein